MLKERIIGDVINILLQHYKQQLTECQNSET